jgi:hypothetical protein
VEPLDTQAHIPLSSGTTTWKQKRAEEGMNLMPDWNNTGFLKIDTPRPEPSTLCVQVVSRLECSNLAYGGRVGAFVLSSAVIVLSMLVLNKL